LPLGSKLACHFNRDGKTISADLQVLESLNSFSTDQRDLLLAGLTQTHRTTDWTKGLSLGLWETKRRFEEVLGFLRLLFTGRVGMGGVAGPVKLFDFAAQEASEGTSRLLIFLTMLSANLAILNFLPIPALDGGHMLFLTFEAIRGKPLNEELQVRLTMAGVLGLLTLMAFVILKDIYSYVG
ncbi:MAG TPA: metalloprotease, partial [Planctomycetaceae bacterium]|nr:metalloprotease [Planctomycetaceae bacterium]